jgi:hypothetical protein
MLSAAYPSIFYPFPASHFVSAVMTRQCHVVYQVKQHLMPYLILQQLSRMSYQVYETGAPLIHHNLSQEDD